jgi:phosphoribosylglycinamide formyltransferase-1
MARLAVLASGTGTILEAILASKLPVALVLADRPCRALDIAKAHHVPAILIDRIKHGYNPRTDWARAAFTRAVAEQLKSHHIDLVAMAGFMTVLAPEIFEQFPNRILNTHPSLLPAFKGAHAAADALAAGVSETGCTVHIATAELDAGPILTQQPVPVLSGDTADILQERIKAVERHLYPETIREYLRSSINQPN